MTETSQIQSSVQTHTDTSAQAQRKVRRKRAEKTEREERPVVEVPAVPTKLSRRDATKETILPSIDVEEGEVQVQEQESIQELSELELTAKIALETPREPQLSDLNVHGLLEELNRELTEQIALSRNDKNKSVSSRVFRDLLGITKRIQKATLKLTKKKVARKGNSKSGFMKPLRVTKEMARFAQWNVEDLHSRVDVTRTLRDYINSKNLINPDNRKEIVPDSKLRKLLQYNEKEEEALTWTYLQKKLKCLFE